MTESLWQQKNLIYCRVFKKIVTIFGVDEVFISSKYKISKHFNLADDRYFYMDYWTGYKSLIKQFLANL